VRGRKLPAEKGEGKRGGGVVGGYIAIA